jgi:ABC-type branched-subunit amino acid transport system substrate-binding protein
MHTLFIVTQDSPPGRLLAGAAGQLAKAAEASEVGAAYIPSAATDFTPYVQEAMQSKADVVFPGLPPTLAIPFLLASRQAGARYTIMAASGEFTPAVIALMGGPNAATENEIGFAALPPPSAGDRFPAIRTFASDMDAELAAGDEAAAADQRNGGSLAAWLCVQIIAREAAGLDVVDSAHLLQALRTAPVIDTLGLTPPWSPSHAAGVLPALPRVANLFGYLITQRNGVEVLADPNPINPFQPPAAPQTARQ